MSDDSQVTVTIRILDREYQIACPEDGRDDLLHSASYLNQRMRAIRNRGKALGVERIAVMTSLNMARELLSFQHEKAVGGLDQDARQRLRRLEQSIDSTLADEESIL